MQDKNRSDWRLAIAATILALSAAIAGAPAEAGGNAGIPLHACFANDSIVMGKRLAPRPDVIRARLNSPACRIAAISSEPSVDDAAAIQRELDRIDEILSNLYRAEIERAKPMSAN